MMKTANDYKKEYADVTKGAKPGDAVIFPDLWIMMKWEADNGFDGPWNPEEVSAWKKTILRDPELGEIITNGYLIMSRSPMGGQGSFDFLYKYLNPPAIKEMLDNLRARGMKNIK